MNRTLQTFYKIYEFYPNLIHIPTSKNIFRRCRPISDARNIASSAPSGNLMKVTIVGAAGKIGQSLCLMLKQSPLIDVLCLHDIKPTSGFAMELTHVDTNCKITAFTGKDNLLPALDNFKDYFLQAFIAIGTNPVNSLVPMACEVLKKGGCYNPKTVFGITTLDTVRANTFVAQVQGLEPECVVVPVIGGHTEETIIPVLSKAKPCAEFTNEELENITMSIRKAHENILKLKPPDSAPLSSAFATARFIISLVKAIQGYPDIIECALVSSKVHPQLKYLSTPLLLGPNGVAKNLGIPELSDFESCMFDNAIPTLISDIKMGEKFVGVQDPPPCDPCDPNPKAPRCPKNWC
ncbi:hypothetical protein NQ314_004686 [Rhamnusium bicolor]|uniref:Malate dehydrogenase n=1 Tax=Rhamnusium bicolor TaxID=1586634 RepID=A0AAV8ZKS0_9CUCU|nr:hypothetical protein NQ314_004686 [Rhamnusium bicolor]